MIPGCSLFAVEKKIVVEHPISEDKLFELCDHLSPDKKAQLVKRLLGDQGIQVVFGNSQLHADTICQINLSDKEQMAGILKVIAERIVREEK